MALRSIELFCDIVAHRSFSKAAEAWGLSQPAVSQALQQLEDRLGVELIDCQVSSPHLSSLGARDIPRREFVTRLARAIPDLAPVVGWTQR